MLRFRPIAPKPAASECYPDVFPSEKKSPIISSKRTKRKYVRVSKSTQRKQKNRTSDDAEKKAVTTLKLLPEKPDGKVSPEGRSWSDHDDFKTINVQDSTTWLNFLEPVMMMNGDKTGGFGVIRSDRTVTVPRVRVLVESWVTVECVTDTCMEGGGLGNTDVERRKNLEADACPSFISNGYNTVEWFNEAYRRLISRQEGERQQQQQAEEEEEIQILVGLVTKEKLPYFLYPAFTCRVRLQYTCGGGGGGTEKGRCCSLTLPCDTWRMDCGGFAWRLDVKAALSLGR